jgi:ribonuclease HI
MSAFKQVSINHISRKDNRGADKLANEAIKKADKSKQFFDNLGR